MVTMLAQVNPLPCSHGQFAVRNGNTEGRAKERGFYVGRHVIRSFDRVHKRQSALGDQHIKSGFHITPHVRVGIFVYRQTGRCVLDKEVHQAYLQLG